MQHKTFLEYNENRNGQEFGMKFATLCEAIARSGVPFEKYWEQVGLPTILQSPYMVNEDELMEGMFDGIKNFFGFGPSASQQMRQNAPTPDWITQHHAQQQAQAAQQQRGMNRHQGRADAALKNVSTKFLTAMRDVLKTLTDEAKTNNDRFTWQIAKMFHDKAVGAVKNMAVNVKQGQDPMASQFNQDRSAMQQGMANSAATAKSMAGSMGGPEAAMKAQQIVQQITSQNAGMTASQYYDAGTGFTQQAKDQFGIPDSWIGKTIKQIYQGGGKAPQQRVPMGGQRGTNPGGPPAMNAPVGTNASTTSGMRQDHAENEGDMMIESLVETYSYKPKFGLF